MCCPTWSDGEEWLGGVTWERGLGEGQAVCTACVALWGVAPQGGTEAGLPRVGGGILM